MSTFEIIPVAIRGYEELVFEPEHSPIRNSAFLPFWEINRRANNWEGPIISLLILLTAWRSPPWNYTPVFILFVVLHLRLNITL